MSAGVYRITNLITKEVYVGYSSNLRKRERDYRLNRVKSQPLIHESISKYGYSNHEFHILFTFPEHPSTNQLKLVESIYIRYYKYWKGSSMLNTNEGGGGSRKLSDVEKTRKALLRRGFRRRGVLQYDLNGVFLKRWNSITEVSNELGLDYNLMIRCLKGKGNIRMVGNFQWRYDTVIREKELGQYDLDGNLIKVWKNAAEYLRSINMGTYFASNINAVANNKKSAKSANGFHWKWIYNENQVKNYENIPPYKKVLNKKSVLQYDLEGNFIKEWESIKDAAEELNITKNEITASINGLKKKQLDKSNESYQWRYKTSDIIHEKISRISKPVILQYELDGTFIKVWFSTKEIIKELGATRKNLNGCLAGNTKSYMGFQWKRERSDTYTTESIEPHSKFNVIYTNPEKKRELLQFGTDGKFIKAWKYPAEVEREIGISCSSISANLKGKLKSAGGFIWKCGHSENVENLPPLRVINQYTRDGKFIKQWKSAKEIVEKTKYSQSSISNVICGRRDHAYGFIWKYES